MSSELSGLIEPHFHQYLGRDDVNVREYAPEEFLTFNRLDVAFKLLFLRGRVLGVSRLEEIYREHIRLFTLGSFHEPGNENKTSIEDYIRVFEELEHDVSESGFRRDRSLIPLGEAGTIINGAHRVAAAIFHHQPVMAAKIPYSDSMYDYRFFLGRGMSVESVEAAVTEFIERSKNCFVACVWPRAKGRDGDLDKLIPDIIYKRSVELTFTAAHNFLAEVYSEEPWLGAEEEGFPGVKGKLMECFTSAAPMRLYVFQAESLGAVQEVKDRIRALYSVGKHSVHITDSHEEAVRLGQVLLNANSRHFLEHGKPWAFRKTLEQMRSLRNELEGQGIGPDHVLVDGSLVLALYGLREARDVDVLIGDQATPHSSGLESHDSELVYHGRSKADLIYDSRYFFYHRGLKFVSVGQLARMKGKRSEMKDHKDLKMMTPLLSESRTLALRAAVRGQLAFFRAKVLRVLVEILKKTGLYNMVRRAYRFGRGAGR